LSFNRRTSIWHSSPFIW